MEGIHSRRQQPMDANGPEIVLKEVVERIRSMEDIASVVRQFNEERTRLKAALPPPPKLLVSPPDPLRFLRGVPLLTLENLLGLADCWEKAAGPLIGAIEKGPVDTDENLNILKQALTDNRLDRRQWVTALLQGKEAVLDETAASLGIKTRTFRFLLGQLVKPCIEQRAKLFKSLVEGLRWVKGYCPLCGALPDLGMTKEGSVERHLLCSLCGHQWTFQPAACPHCGTKDEQAREILRIQEREHQWAELCYECGKYLIYIDTARCANQLTFEAVSAGMAHLDIWAQQRGFLPVALCPWSSVVCEDIASGSLLHAEAKGRPAQLH